MSVVNCFRKMRFIHEARAVEMARKMSEKFGNKQRAYYCGMCDAYHLTTLPTLAETLEAESKREAAKPKHGARTGAERFASRIAKWHAMHPKGGATRG